MELRLRINVVGSSGSGKSTFSKQLAERLGLPYIELDELHWKPNWEPSTNKELFDRLEQALSADAWVLDGNYKKATSIKWRRAQIVVFLDLPFPIVFYRVVKRSLVRSITRQRLWHGNRESLRKNLLSHDSVILWMIGSFRKNRRMYAELFADPQYSHIQFIRLQSRKSIEAFVRAPENHVTTLAGQTRHGEGSL